MVLVVEDEVCFMVRFKVAMESQPAALVRVLLYEPDVL